MLWYRDNLMGACSISRKKVLLFSTSLLIYRVRFIFDIASYVPFSENQHHPLFLRFETTNEYLSLNPAVMFTNSRKVRKISSASVEVGDENVQ